MFMKKFILLLSFCFLLVGLDAQAQFEKGRFMMGGTASLDIDKEKDADLRVNLGLQPRVGYFIADRLAVGAEFDFYLTTVGEGSQVDLFIGPFGRYYHKSNFFGEVKAGIADGGFKFGFGAGYALMINDFIAFEPIANFRLGDGFGMNIQAGFQLYLDKLKFWEK